jgi:hypothetical protein
MLLASQFSSLNDNMKNDHASTNRAVSGKGHVLNADSDAPMSNPYNDNVPLMHTLPRSCAGSLSTNIHFILLLVLGDMLQYAHSLQAQAQQDMAIPSWILQPTATLLSKGHLPLWKERQIEQGSYCIISTLNVSLILCHISLYLRNSLSSTMSWISKMSLISTSGGAMSRQCTRLTLCKCCLWAQSVANPHCR